MCLLLYRPAGAVIDRSVLHLAWSRNSDGGGFAVVDETRGLMTVSKGYMSFKRFYKAVAEHDGKEMMIHMRWATPGTPVTPEMCHPFTFNTGDIFETEVNGKKVPRYQFAVGHNHRVDYPANTQGSDTYHFVTSTLAPVMRQNPWFLDQQAGMWMLEKTIKSGGIEYEKNKLCIFRYDREEKALTHYIVNPTGGLLEKQAHMSDDGSGVWYSNHSYRKTRTETASSWLTGFVYDKPGLYKRVVYEGTDITVPSATVTSHHGYHGNEEGYYGDAYGLEGEHQGPNTGAASTTVGATSGHQMTDDEMDQWYEDVQDEADDPYWSKPDAAGWKWDFDEDCWHNAVTGMKREYLKDHVLRPKYMTAMYMGSIQYIRARRRRDPFYMVSGLPDLPISMVPDAAALDAKVPVTEVATTAANPPFVAPDPVTHHDLPPDVVADVVPNRVSDN